MINSSKFLRYSFVLLITVFLSTMVSSNNAVQISPKQKVAVINGKPIYMQEIINIHASMPEQLRTAPLPRLYPFLLKQLVDAQLIAAEADKFNVTSSKKFKEALENAKKLIKRQLYIKQEVTDKISKPGLAKTRYNKLIKKIRERKLKEYRARHALFKDQQGARKALQTLNSGKSFEDIIVDSIDQRSKKQGGDLGYFQEGQMPKEFVDAVKKAKLNKPTIVKTAVGWHVFEKLDSRLYSPKFAELAEQIKSILHIEALEKLSKRLLKKAKVELFDLKGNAVELEDLLPSLGKGQKGKKG